MAEHAANAEYTVWEGGPSQLMNLPAFLTCTLLSPLVIPIFVGVWKWLTVRCTQYELTSERLRITTGVLSREMHEVELYRVKDTWYQEPFWLRLFGRGNIVLEATDRSHPTLTLEAIRGGREVREHLRQHVEALRSRKRVFEVD